MKVVRDPIHGYIEISEPEFSLIDTLAFQRLRGIKQLARADLVYPSLVHTRFEHSLGVMHVASEMGKRLKLEEPQIKALRAAALLHDIGHGPYSHVFENVLENGQHEDVTCKIITENEEMVDAIGRSGLEPEDVVEVFENTASISHEILSSPLDADKIDYLLRDAYHAGVAYGLFDYHRLIWTLDRHHDGHNDILCTAAKGRDALLSFVLARHFMHLQVYQHHVRAISDNMLVRAIRLGKDEGVFPRELFDVSSPDFLRIFLEYDDDKMARDGLSRTEGSARRIFDSLKRRYLFKRAYQKSPKEIEDAAKRKRLVEWFREKAPVLESRISLKAGVPSEMVICYLMRIDNPLSPDNAIKEPMVKVGEHLKELQEVVDFRPMEATQQCLYVFCQSGCREKVGNAVKEVIAEL
jgi:putative nucleotidyltransferase with HDIG domain